MRNNLTESRFTLDFQHTIGPDEADPVVYRAQQYLHRFGYLKAGFTPLLLDAATQSGLRLFQERRRLDATGLLDRETADEMELPRCGLADNLPQLLGESSDGVDFSGRCSHQGERRLTYTFITDFPRGDLREDQMRTDIALAFAAWGEVIHFEFVEDAANPTFKIGWFDGAHLAGAVPCLNFDGLVGHILAHAFPPSTCGGPRAGHCHFDLREPWTRLPEGVRRRNDVDLLSLALHEIGHLLGLPHNADPRTEAVMAPVYEEARKTLRLADRQAIRDLYGLPLLPLNILANFENLGALEFREDEFTESVNGRGVLNGFQLGFSRPIEGVSIHYKVRRGDRDSDFVAEGEFSGSGEPSPAGPIAGFAIQLVGSNADKYNVFYKAKFGDDEVTRPHRNGELCGDPAQSRPIQAILVGVEPRA